MSSTLTTIDNEFAQRFRDKGARNNANQVHRNCLLTGFPPPQPFPKRVRDRLPSRAREQVGANSLGGILTTVNRQTNLRGDCNGDS